MPSVVRWILVAPIAVGSTVALFFLLTIVWNIVGSINIVPQGGLVDLAMANAGINGFAAAGGVLAGAHTAPGRKAATAIALAVLFTAFAVLTLIAGNAFRDQLSMTFGWHVYSTVAWLVGSIGAAYAVHAGEASAEARATGS